MHQAYAAAEARAIRSETVADLSVESSPMAAYAEALMLQLAEPQRLSHRNWTGRANGSITGHTRSSSAATRPLQGGHAVDLAVASGPPGRRRQPVRLPFAFSTSPASPPRSAHASSASRKAPSLPRSDWVPIAPRLAAQDLLKTLQRAWFDSAPARDFRGAPSPSPWSS